MRGSGRHVDAHEGPAVAVIERQLVPGAVDRIEPPARERQAAAGAERRRGAGARSRLRRRAAGRRRRARRCRTVPGRAYGAMPCLTAFSTSGCSRNGGTSTPRAASSMSKRHRQTRSEPDALDVEVRLDQIQLAFERHGRHVHPVEDRLHHIGQPDDHRARQRRILVDEGEQRIERVQHEVRLELRADRRSARLRARRSPAPPRAARARVHACQDCARQRQSEHGAVDREREQQLEHPAAARR